MTVLDTKYSNLIQGDKYQLELDLGQGIFTITQLRGGGVAKSLINLSGKTLRPFVACYYSNSKVSVSFVMD